MIGKLDQEDRKHGRQDTQTGAIAAIECLLRTMSILCSEVGLLDRCAE